jgi:hypothetical protein
VVASLRAGPIRYVLIPLNLRRPTDLITNVETTSEEVTVDSPSFELKNKLGTRLAMLRQRCQSWADVTFGRVAPTPVLLATARQVVPRAAASIKSP